MTDQKDKIYFYQEKNLSVHIDCYSGRYYNGRIIEINSKKGFVLIYDRVLGEIPIMLDEIQNVEKMREPEQ